jgi:hypothetical protein
MDHYKAILFILGGLIIFDLVYLFFSGPISAGEYIFFKGRLLTDSCNKNLIDDTIKLNTEAVLYYKFNNQEEFGESKEIVCDFSGKGNDGYVYGANWNSTEGKYQDGGFEFSNGDYIMVPDNIQLSPTNTGEMSVSFWVKFEDFNFPGEAEGYVHYLGKGNWEQGYEWMFREYNQSNIQGRSKRLSFYTFNSSGGQGVGSFSQEDIMLGEWIHLVGVMNGTDTQLWKNGQLVDVDGYERIIFPEHGRAPLFIGTTDGSSYLNGSIDELRIYNRKLDRNEIKSLYELIPKKIIK